jgi:PAP2 superfamily
VKGQTAVVLCFTLATAWAQSTPTDDDRRERFSYSLDHDGIGALLLHSVGNTFLDQKPIWTSPFQMTSADAKWWALFGAGTGVGMVYDRRLSSHIPNDGQPHTFASVMSPAGQYWALYPAALAFSLAGKHYGDQKAYETGGILVQALTDSLAVAGAFKLAAGRERPNQGDGGGHFLKGGHSFPSAHAIGSWTFASVAAHKYGNKKVIPVIAYTLATAVSVSRVTGRDHFASDVLAGGALGFFLGRFAVRTRERASGGSHAQRASILIPDIAPTLHHGALGISLRWGTTPRNQNTRVEP